ncbi:MAG: hypothetical protein K2F97_04240, partial [Muribaculaceae bacterium]|nr:hypothetical protein [Muribaculaceae bacterium]
MWRVFLMVSLNDEVVNGLQMYGKFIFFLMFLLLICCFGRWNFVLGDGILVSEGLPLYWRVLWA